MLTTENDAMRAERVKTVKLWTIHLTVECGRKPYFRLIENKLPEDMEKRPPNWKSCTKNNLTADGSFTYKID